MSTITETLLKVRDALLSSEKIRDFCQTKYDRPVKVFLGADIRDLPEVENCPYILLDRGKAVFKNENMLRDVACEFYLFICIYQPNVQEDQGGLIYTGVLEIDSLAQLVRQEICKSVAAAINFTEEEVPSANEAAPLRQYPVYVHFEKADIKTRENRE